MTVDCAELRAQAEAVGWAWIAWLETAGPPPLGVEWEHFASALADLVMIARTEPT